MTTDAKCLVLAANVALLSVACRPAPVLSPSEETELHEGTETAGPGRWRVAAPSIRDPGALVALDPNGALWGSEDAGDTWLRMDPGRTYSHGTLPVPGSSAARLTCLRSSTAVRCSRDSGRSWESVLRVPRQRSSPKEHYFVLTDRILGFVEAYPLDYVAPSPGMPGTLPPYVSKAVSTDLGRTWHINRALDLSGFEVESAVILRSRIGLVAPLGEGRSFLECDDNLECEPVRMLGPTANFSLKVNPAEPDLWLYLSRQSGISRDRGCSYEPIDEAAPGGWVDANPPWGTYLYERDGFLRRTHDGGRTWQDLQAGPWGSCAPVYGFDGTAYCADDRLYRTLDGGDNWEEIRPEERLVTR